MKISTRVAKTPPLTGESRHDYSKRIEWLHGEGDAWPESKLHFPTHRVLVIPDLHAPAIHPHALSFLTWVQDTYQCDTVISIGDIADMHSITFHTVDPDLWSAGREIDVAAATLQPFHDRWPNIDVTLGNHDARIARKVFATGIPARVLKPLSDTLGVPTWRFNPHVELDGVHYVHDATGGTNGASRTALKLQQPVVAGHVHSTFGIVHQTCSLWGMQVGTLVNPVDPRFNYARNAQANTRLGCGVVLDGHTPICIPLTAFEARSKPF